MRQPAPAAIRDGAGSQSGCPGTCARRLQAGDGEGHEPGDPSRGREPAVFAAQNDAKMAANLATVPAPSRTARRLERLSDGRAGAGAAQRGAPRFRGSRVCGALGVDAVAGRSPGMEMEEEATTVMQNAEFRIQTMTSPAACLHFAFCILIALKCRLQLSAHSSQQQRKRRLRDLPGPGRSGLCRRLDDIRDGQGDIYARILPLNGRPAGPERRLTNGPEDSYEASIDRLGDDLVVAWDDQASTGQQTAKLGMWGRDGTNRWMHVFDSGTRNPVILSDGTVVFCAWIQAEGDGREGVFAGWWDSNGRPRSMPVRLARPARRHGTSTRPWTRLVSAGWCSMRRRPLAPARSISPGPSRPAAPARCV